MATLRIGEARFPGGRVVRWSVLAVFALIVGLIVHGRPVQAAGALVTVPNGITTSDLSAVGVTPAALASSLVGTGVSISNVHYSGANAQAGTIHVVDPAVVSFNDGIIMSSGNIADVVGPNKSDGITGDMAGPADPDLNGLISNTQTVNPVTFDAATLEFDFVPNDSQVYFTYTFGSDEYLEWVNLFNDVFAFYVNGQNCATVPGGAPVSIDTINSTVNPQLFRDNSFSSPPANPINIESDGLSVEMICSAPVNAGQTNHMKLAIADTSDQILDSVVMIKSGSLSTTKPESCNDGVDNNDDTKVDDADPICQATTTPPPAGSGGIGSDSSAPPFTGNEGSPIGLDAAALGWTATSKTLSTSWTVTGINGTTGTCDVTPAGRVPLNLDHSIAVVHAVCPDDGEYVARVDGWDNENQSAFDKDVDFFVHNAPPTVAIDAPAPGALVALGSPVELSASVADPGVSDAVTCTIDWGDGTTAAGTIAAGACTGSHVYPTLGDQLISVRATDNAGDSSADKRVITVVAPEVTLTSDLNPSTDGDPVTFTATTSAGTGGTMTFLDGSTPLGDSAVTGGSATLTTSTLDIGSHPITAEYRETPSSSPAVSAVLVQQVDPTPTTTTSTTTTSTSTSTSTSTTSTSTTSTSTTSTTTIPATTTTTAATTTTTPVMGDAVSVAVSGAYTYSNSAAVPARSFHIASDTFGVASVTGSATLPGKQGGSATVNVNVNRFLWWSFGTLTVRDPGAGIPEVTGLVFFGPAPAKVGNSTSLSANWFTFVNGLQSFTVTATITDGA